MEAAAALENEIQAFLLKQGEMVSGGLKISVREAGRMAAGQ
jgi:hypothetical protein